jgi:hypothetical protein
MSSVGFKQLRINSGYYINVGDVRTSFYQNNGTDVAPLISANIFARSSINSTFMATAGSAVFRDHGKNLVSSGRTFRKVQLMVSTGVAFGGTAPGTDGVGGFDSAQTNFLTGYIELPGASSGTVGALCTPVARLG